MRASCGSVAVAVSLFLAGLAEANESLVQLSTNKAVYKKGNSDPVTIKVINNGNTAFVMSSPMPFSIWQGNKAVLVPASIMMTDSIAPGESRSWVWNKKNWSGKSVPPGTYTVKVGHFQNPPNTPFEVSLNIAITSSGKLAGQSPFPLTVGNEWTYSSGGLSPTQKTKVSHKNGYWSRVTNLAGKDRWVALNGSGQPTLFTIAALTPASPALALFRFNRPIGDKYPTQLNGKSVLFTVQAKNETVVTPAGTFTKCYTLSVSGSDYKSFTFAPGVGLVRYIKLEMIDIMVVYRLQRAKVKGVDGKTYIIGN